MTIATEYAITVSMFVEKTYIITGMDKADAIAEAKERIFHDTPFDSSAIKWDVMTEDHTKIIHSPI